MIFGRRGRGAGPAATWPGVPLGSQRVLAPVGRDGELWGTREHGRLFVQVRRRHEPQDGPPGVRYQEMTVAEVCRRLPPDAGAGIGRTARRLDCTPATLNQAPAQVDLRTVDEDSPVRPADVTDWGAPPQEETLAGARCYTVVDRRAMRTAAVVVVDRVEQDVVDAFHRWCSAEQVEVPLQLWESGRLPGWLRRATRI